ncbi:hypothetical protein NWP22_12245 [Anabaenopsis tanganyikae CS-531]|uniref:Uncharacterized protein n=2 Tax=Anabaenopsis TaxID=110103 RepID=A0ABT5AUM5_9CYAN|nr:MULTISPECIES: hypothetical protein [Anabaenopsis]MDB9540141.1 hypothetical protein [Anabaenopsis arnoldii]MDH6092535.1 hypothetical protein [Anabaenopsis arnoldii]MDH6106628.1 hypothetical protein [Anabaenopsis tanganyikae CS-531]
MTHKNNYITDKARIITVVILTGIFSLGSGLTIINRVTAATVAPHPHSYPGSLLLAATDTPADNQVINLPESVKNAVLQAVSEDLDLPISQLKIIQAQPQTWNNGCLNLASPDEFCTQALVPGWRVTVDAVDQTLVYHTNSTGSSVRLNQEAGKITQDCT